MWKGEFENGESYQEGEGQRKPKFSHWLASKEQVDEIKETLEKNYPEFKRLLTFPGGRIISKDYNWYRDDSGYDIIVQSDPKRSRFIVTCSEPVIPILNDVSGLIPFDPIEDAKKK